MTIRPTTLHLTLGLPPFLILSSAFALAQTASAPATSAEPPPDEVLALDKLVVTGEKLGRTTQETQASVATLTGRELENTTDTSLFDVFQRTANTFTNADGFSIRGIANNGVTYTEGSDLATVLVDGAQFDSQMLGFNGLSIWDLDQIEILRGPQSTSQGRNSLAGAVVANTRNPTFYWDAAARATYADYNTSQFALAVGGPLVADTLAFRFTAEKQISDGYYTNVTLHDDQWGQADNTSYRGKLLFQPARWRSFSALLTYAHLENHDNERAYGYGPTRDSLFRREAIENTPADFFSRSRLASLEVKQEFANSWLLTSTTSWSDFFSTSAYDGDRTPTEDLVYGFGYDNYTKSQEIRLLAKGDTWKLVSGLYYSDSRRSYTGDGPFYYTVPSPLDAVFGLASPARALLNVHQASQVDTENAALFLNGEWKPVRRWTLNAGVRFDREQLDRDSAQDVLLLRGFPGAVALMAVPSYGIPLGAPADIVLQSIASGASAAANGTDKFNTLLPSAGLTYHWTDDLSTGATVTRGYRSGGVSFNQLRAIIVPYDPEYTTNYELSLRSQWLDKKITANANVFYVDWQDQQVGVQLSNDSYDRQVENAGKSTYYGFELELREKLSARWSAYQNIGHTRTKFDDFVSSTADYSGNEFPNAPRWTLGAGLTWQHPRGWFGTGSATWIANVYNNAANEPMWQLGERFLVNAKFGYAARHWSVYLYGTNLLDDEYFDTVWAENSGDLAGRPGAPRIVGVGVETRF